MDDIYFRNDLTKAYSDKRKNISQKETEDLLRCVLKFLRKKQETEEYYAYKIPRVGFMYKKFEQHLPNYPVNTQNQLFDEMFTEITQNSIDNQGRSSLLTLSYKIDRIFKGKTKEEIQQWQNTK